MIERQEVAMSIKRGVLIIVIGGLALVLILLMLASMVTIEGTVEFRSITPTVR